MYFESKLVKKTLKKKKNIIIESMTERRVKNTSNTNKLHFK